MKKLLVVLLLFLFPAILFAHEIDIKIGASFSDNVKTKSSVYENDILLFSSNGTCDTAKVTPAISFDFFSTFHKNLKIGIGCDMSFFDTRYSDLCDYYFFAPYFAFKPTIQLGDYNAYCLFKLGTALVRTTPSFSTTNHTTNDIFHSYSLGVEYNNYIIEFSFSFLNWDIERRDIYGSDTILIDFDYSQKIITLFLGYKFTL